LILNKKGVMIMRQLKMQDLKNWLRVN